MNMWEEQKQHEVTRDPFVSVCDELIIRRQNPESLSSCHQHGPQPTSAPTSALSLKQLLQFSLLNGPHLLQETHSN